MSTFLLSPCTFIRKRERWSWTIDSALPQCLSGMARGVVDARYIFISLSLFLSLSLVLYLISHSCVTLPFSPSLVSVRCSVIHIPSFCSLTLDNCFLLSWWKYLNEVQSVVLTPIHFLLSNSANCSSGSSSCLLCVCAPNKKKNSGVRTQSWLCKCGTKWLGPSQTVFQHINTLLQYGVRKGGV